MQNPPRSGAVALTLITAAAWASASTWSERPRPSLGVFSEQPADAAAAESELATAALALLSDRCYVCHGNDPGTLEADLRLDLREVAVADRGGYAAIVPGDAEASEVLYRLRSDDDEERMPPPHAKLTLTSDEVDLIARWIDAGAAYPTHWSFVRPERHAAPAVGDSAWPRDDLDRFVLAELEAIGIAPSPEVDRATLLRRVHLDLTGLPPSLAQLDAFLASDDPGSYARAVDELLASPAHAEHLAATWLDVARYADTFGYQSDVAMNVWPWRDWVLQAFASNLPFDQFLTHQLAGDLLEDATGETRLATAFNRLHRQTNEGGSVEEEFRVAYVSDRVETMSTAFLGLTVACARCHDHKFDPISQADFYELGAFFDDIDESGLYSHFTNAVPTPALDLPTDEQAERLAELEQRVLDAERAALELARGIEANPGHGRAPVAHFPFDAPEPTHGRIPKASAEGVGEPRADAGESGAGAEVAPVAKLIDGPSPIEGWRGEAFRLSGEDALHFPGVGVFERSDPFSFGMALSMPHFERAVVLHRTKSWTDSGSRGYQLLVEDGRLTVALVHFWPGDAIAIRALEPLEPNAWHHVAFTYDGSSRARGLTLFVDGERVATEVVRDHLTRTIRGGSIGDLAIGSRFRDKGYKGGAVDELVVFDRELAADEVRALAVDGVWEQAEPEGDAEPGFDRIADDLEAELDRAGAELLAARAARDKHRDSIRQIMTMTPEPELPAAQRKAYLLDRGEYTERREALDPAFLSALPDLGIDAPKDRLDLARWLTHPDHPTTARVAVDRLWRLVFGVGLTATPDDLGSQGAVPVHRELLDTLARDLVESGWDQRALLRRLVLSSTYRQSSVPPADERGTEREARRAELFAVAHRGRLPAETIRDAALQAAGLLVHHTGGPSVFPYQPLGLWKEKAGSTYPTGRGDDLRRRSLYTFWKRTSPPPAMAMFDVPAREVCVAARQSTATPLQALVLWNDPQFVEVAVVLGARALELAPDDATRIELLMRSLTSRRPTQSEAEVLAALLVEQRAAFRANPEAARALASFDLELVAHPPAPAAEGASSANSDDEQGSAAAEAAAADQASASASRTREAVERAALAVLASTILAMDETVTRR
ncbi:MAG: DUF1549 domain-containing protein [Planctomycetota bacterium]|nr:DUF1549 domain-containing protein [Planctomycetota bacterium]